MSYAHVKDPAGVIDNVHKFKDVLKNYSSLSPDVKQDIGVLIARSRLWVAVQSPDGGYDVGPSKYIAVSGITPARYTQIRRHLHSGNAANHLRQWLPKQPEAADHPAWDQVKQIAATHAPGQHPHLNAEVFVIPPGSQPQAAPVSQAPATTLTPAEERGVELVLGLSALLAPHVRANLAQRIASL